MKTQIKTNWRVEVWPHVNQWVRDEIKKNAIAKDFCDEILEGIKRHVDGFSKAYIEHDTELVCSYCGGQWTEENDTYNGGCCEKDEANAPEVTP